MQPGASGALGPRRPHRPPAAPSPAGPLRSSPGASSSPRGALHHAGPTLGLPTFPVPPRPHCRLALRVPTHPGDPQPEARLSQQLSASGQGAGGYKRGAAPSSRTRRGLTASARGCHGWRGRPGRAFRGQTPRSGKASVATATPVELTRLSHEQANEVQPREKERSHVLGNVPRCLRLRRPTKGKDRPRRRRARGLVARKQPAAPTAHSGDPAQAARGRVAAAPRLRRRGLRRAGARKHLLLAAPAPRAASPAAPAETTGRSVPANQHLFQIRAVPASAPRGSLVLLPARPLKMLLRHHHLR